MNAHTREHRAGRSLSTLFAAGFVGAGRTIAIAFLGLALFTTACGGSSPAGPNAPSPTPDPSVSAVTVTTASSTGSSFQLTATTRMSDGSTRDVTALSQWESSNRALATVSATGLLTVVSGGDVDVRATYQGVVGALHLLVSTPPAPTTFEISGVVTEVAPLSRTLSGVRLQITSGPGAGTTMTSDAGGLFRFAAVAPGVIAIEASRDGYILWNVSNLMVSEDYRQLEVVLYPTPPDDQSGTTASARCNDGTWSWAKARGDSCVANGGIAYTVCPGLLCNSLTAP